MIGEGLPEATLVRPEGKEKWRGIRAHAPFALALEQRTAAKPAAPAPPVQATPAPTPAPSGERVFLQKADVLITSSRAVLRGTTYALANLTSVRVYIEPRPMNWLLLGILLMALGLMCFVVLECTIIGWIGTLGGFGLILAYLCTPVKHWVRIGTAGAETNAVWYPRPEEAQTVSGALSQAIVSRG